MSLKPVIALVGEDAFLQLQRLAELAAQLPGDAQRMEIDGERAELADVLDELRSFSLFGGAKLVVVRSADAFVTRFRQPLEDYVTAPADSATLVLRLNSLPANQRIHKLISKHGTVEQCAAPKDLASWAVQHARNAHGATLKPDAARLLAELIGDDMGRLDGEIAKLALQADGAIGIEHVRDGVAFQREQQMWEMTGAVAAGKHAEAVKRWRQLLSSDPSAEFRAVTWLTIWLQNVSRALVMKSRGQSEQSIAQALRIWPASQQAPFFRTATALGTTGAARAITLLADIDRQSKSGVGDAAENVERFLLQLAM